MIKVILKAGSIPLGSTVTKVRGDKTYLLKDRLTLFDAQSQIRELKASVDTKILVSSNGDGVAVSNDTELCWYADEQDILNFLTKEEGL